MRGGDTKGASRAIDVLAILALAKLLFAMALPGILAGTLGPKAYDHRFFHLPLVRSWAETWPFVDVRDYNSATGPLYHWLMAGAAQIVGTAGGPETSPALQAVNVLWAVLLAAVVYLVARRRLAPTLAFIATLPVAVSPYVVGNATWMMTDNLALAFAALAIGGAAFGTVHASSRLGQGIAATAAVAVRQINLWLLLPIAASWWLSGRRSTASFLVACAGPVLVLGTFVLLWQGLVPPRFKDLHASGVNPAAIGFTLLLVGVYGAPLLAAAPQGTRLLLGRPTILFGVALLGGLVSLIGPSFASEAHGRNGGWVWRLVAEGPIVLDRSPIIVLGGAFGACVLAALVAEAEARREKFAAFVLGAALLGFTAAHVANAQIFQRYYDPMVLLVLVWLAALLAPSRRLVAALLAMAAMQGVFAIAVLAIGV